MRIFQWLAFLSMATLAMAQPVLRLKVPPVAPGSYAVAPGAGRIHVIIQFADYPTAATLFAVQARGAILLQYVPDNAFLISIDSTVNLDGLGIGFGGAYVPTQKVSPLIANSDPAVSRGYYLVEFQPDVAPADARQLILNSPVELVENPDLSKRHLLVHIPDLTQEAQALASLASQDSVNYIFPASSDLIQGGLTDVYLDMLSQNISTVGDGWDGPGLNPVTLKYFFSHLTALLPELTTQGEILRAMADWAQVAQILWQPGTSAIGNQTINVLFAAGDHGDGFPFDGPGGVLAHTFYPPPLTSEPLAGDVHFDDTEIWRTGSYVDVFSVALHELGHALGLAHSDDPTAVMYPYYKTVTGLAQRDKDAILTLYAAQTGSGSPVIPLAVIVNPPPANTASTSISLTGLVTGGSGTPSVSWSTNQGQYGATSINGTNWLAAGIPLAIGPNSITMTGTDATGNVYSTVTVTRQSDTTPPPLTVTVNAPPPTTTATSISLTGTVTGGSGATSVRWTLGTGVYAPASVNGTSWLASNIPLAEGSNSITITATDSTGSISQTVSVTRQSVVVPLALTVTAPPSTTTATSISVSGTVSGGSGGAAVTWSANTGGSGAASITGGTWSIASIPLAIGLNNITVTAADSTGTTSQTVSVTRQTVTPPPGGDTTGPTLAITYPSTTSFATTLSWLTFKGTASDRSGVATVTWSTNTGSSGTATGTTSWSASIPLLVGFNQVTIRTADTVGNISWRTVVVTRR